MQARINHLTILSENNYALGRFYEGFFHMRPAGARSATQSVSIGDGHIGLNLKPRLTGQRAQLDHFGIEVDDIDLAVLFHLFNSVCRNSILERLHDFSRLRISERFGNSGDLDGMKAGQTIVRHPQLHRWRLRGK